MPPIFMGFVSFVFDDDLWVGSKWKERAGGKRKETKTKLLWININ